MKLFNIILMLFIATPVMAGTDKGVISQNIISRQSWTFDNKLLGFSNDFIGKPYALDPLGEGVGFDPDPIYRFDKFDCVTYVETVMALSSASNFDDFINQKKKVSYLNNEIDYVHRKHFFEIDQKDTVYDITQKLGAPTENISANIDKKTWLIKKDKKLISEFKSQDITLSYISKNNVSSIDINKLPRISIMAIVINNPKSQEKIGSGVIFSHVGFLIKNNEKLYFRNASSKLNRVADQDFFEYVSNLDKSNIHIGIKIFRINKL